MKTKYQLKQPKSIDYRARMESHYRTKYFNLFLSSYEWEGLKREERDFIMRQFWRRGNIAAFRINDDLLGFAPFVPQNFNMYRAPTEVTLVNERGVDYIPSNSLKTGNIRNNVARQIDEPEVVLGWAQYSMTPIQETLNPLIDQIVDLEMCLRTNRAAQKLPLLYAVTPENKNKMNDLVNSILGDEISIAIEVSDMDSIKGVQQAPPYIIDKLSQARDNIENTILTILGIDNGGRGKAERVQVDEINANNELINDYQSSVLDNLREWCELVDEAYGTNIAVNPKFKAVDSFHDEEPQEGNENDTIAENV